MQRARAQFRGEKDYSAAVASEFGGCKALEVRETPILVRPAPNSALSGPERVRFLGAPLPSGVKPAAPACTPPLFAGPMPSAAAGDHPGSPIRIRSACFTGFT